MRQKRDSTQEWTKELFKKYPELYIEEFEKRLVRASKEVEVLLEYLKKQGFKPKRVVDLNCGIGRHSIELAKRGIEVLGTDISSYYIKIARERAQEEVVTNKASFKTADMRKIALILRNEKPFDGIINLWTSFGYYDRNINNDILRQCLKLVRTGGFFVLEIINKDWLVKNFQEKDFTKSKGKITLEERRFDLNKSRIYLTRTYLRQKDKYTFVCEKEVILDYQVWNLHELMNLFKINGWQFKIAYPGMIKQKKDISLIDARRLLLIAEKC